MGKEKGDLMVLPSLGVKASTFREESEERPYKRQVMAIDESFEESEDSKERRQKMKEATSITSEDIEALIGEAQVRADARMLFTGVSMSRVESTPICMRMRI